MKKFLFLSVLISFAVICSCQKQDSATEQRLAQREAALDEREKALDDREKALIERERATANTRPIRPEPQSRRQVADPAQIQVERERRIQQLPPEFRALIPDASQIRDRSEKPTPTREQVGQTQRSLEDRRKKISGAIAAPEPQSPETDATSPSPTPQ